MQNTMKKIFLIIGARPNFMKAFPVYQALKEDFVLTLIHTGQHFDEKMSKVFFEQLKFPKPDIHLTLDKRTKAGDYDDKLYVDNCNLLDNKDSIIEELTTYSGDLGQLGEIRDKLKIEFEKGQPDLVIVFGDVTSTLAAGLSAKMLNIELAHVESGLRSGDIKMPEEVNRILTDHITKYYFVTEQSGVDNLTSCGITENVYLVGNTMIDTQKRYLQQALDTKYYEKLGVNSKEYVLITLHRPSNVDDMDKLREIFDDFQELSKTEKLVYPIHPRTKKNLEKMGYLEKVESNSNIILEEPLGYLEFTCLMANCKYVVTDSGGLQEESTALDIPCFTLRENTERPCTLIRNNGTNQMISKISEIELKECKGSMDLWDGKSSERILIKIMNIFKSKHILHLRSKNPLCVNRIVFNKYKMYKFFQSKNIVTPENLYTGHIDNLDSNILKNNNTVIKKYHGCSNKGIMVITYNVSDDTYYSYFDKKSFLYKELIEIIKENYTSNILIEQKLGNTKDVPIDIKIMCYKGELKEIHLIKQGKIIEQSIYSCVLDKFVTKEYFCKPIQNRINNNNLINEVDCDIESMLKYGKEVLSKLDNEHLYRIDCYYYNNQFYIGEITICSGPHVKKDITPKFVRLLLNDLFS